MTLYTVGHGQRSTEELAVLLQEAGVPLLVDVRRYPSSRRHPHLARARLEEHLPAHGIEYEWREELGGRRSRRAGSRHTAWAVDAFAGYADHMDTPEFRRSFMDLLSRQTLAVMCAETLWWRCHRRLIADAAVLRGVEVVHLMALGKASPHSLSRSVRVDEEGWPVYDVGQLAL
jgi:uncharacterized protein (DUF488 family)